MGNEHLPGMPSLPDNWSWQVLETLCERVSVGHVGETSSVFCGPEGIPFLRSQNVRPGCLEIDDIRFVTSEFHEKSRKSQLKPGDVLVVRVGQNRGDCCVVPDNVGELNCANIVFARLEDVRYSDYIGYFLNSNFGRASLLAVSTGSAQEVLNTKSVAKVLVPLPPVEEAEEIGVRIRVLDDKIQLNRQTNETLEQMAQALFKSWFVDFDPVIDNALEAGNTIPDELQDRAERRKLQLAKPDHQPLPDDIRQLFPSEFELTDELGWVPMGWEVKHLKELSSKISKGTTPRKSDLSDVTDAPKTPFLKVRDITDNGYILKDNLELIPESISIGVLKRSVLKANDILVSIAGTIGRVTVIENDLNDANCNQAVAFIRLSDKEKMLTLAKLNLQSERVQNEMSSKIVQAVQANFSLTGLGEINILLPCDIILSQFNKNTKAYFEKISLGSSEAGQLTKLRDTLLPKLISGELRLPADALSDAEQQPAAVIA